MALRPWDYTWCVCIILANILWCTRKIINALYGHGLAIIEFRYDRATLAEIAPTETVRSRRILYRAINVLIPITFVCGLALFLLLSGALQSAIQSFDQPLP